MKALAILVISFFLVSSTKKTIIEGQYINYFGSELSLYPNHTYYYRWRLCMTSTWVKGKWKMSGDTILLNPILIYDTLYYYDSLLNKYNDSLILSLDTIAKRIVPNKDKSIAILSSGQNAYGNPRMLYFHNGKLFDIRNGRIQRAKRRGLIDGSKKYPSYYFKKVD